MAGRFTPVGSRMPFAELEAELRAFWREHRVFERSVEEEPERPLYTFYEGPPTANGVPGVHHVLARVFKDLFPRYKTMQGYRSPRKGGWDTHGLPVELEVERELGLKSKAEIEAYGVAEFNAKCRESVFRYVKQWEDLTERTAFWLDMRDAYVTYHPEYIESCWWIIKQLWEAGLVYEDRRTTPHCPRCETSLSSHELALGYRENTEDPSVTVKFRVDAKSLPASLQGNGETFLLAWTTTPWTLPGNTALAVAIDEEYGVVRGEGGERLVLAAERVEATLGEGAVVEGMVAGSALVGVRYEGLYEPGEWGVLLQKFEEGRLGDWEGPSDSGAWRRAVAGDFVSMEEGTGIVHIAPAFGADDYALGRREGLVFAQPVDLNGRVTGERSPFAGLFVKDADQFIIEELRSRGRIVRSTTIRHTYPFCWRCGTPLLYYAKPSWYIATTKVGESLRRSNQDLIQWHPEHLRDGRYGDWIANNVDWAISRERYWGTPLPIWRCQGCNATEAVGSFAELGERAGGELDLPDPHRPYVDAVELACGECGGVMRRIPEVADAWFDSGAMPYAQWHYPFENQEAFKEQFPAEFICEGVDQTRGWFYSLHAEAVLLHAAGAVPEPTAYQHVVSVGHILDETGEKMSKSKGNVVNPWEVLDEHGADALRWYLYTASPPGNPRRFSSALVGEAQRKYLLTLWNTYSFFVTYANIDGFDPTALSNVGGTGRSELDRWLLSALHSLIEEVTRELDAYEPTNAARAIEEFVDQLSNWYVRRSRRRFWKSEDDADKTAAYRTLYEALVTVALLTAPLTPYVSDAMYRNLVVGVDGAATESVHLARWPESDASQRDAGLEAAMPLVQRVASLGRAARSGAGIKVRQPLRELLVSVRNAGEGETLQRYEEMLLDELNVKRMRVVAGSSELATAVIKPNLKVLGPRLGKEAGRLQVVLKELSADEGAAIAARVAAGEKIEVGGVELGAEDLLVESKPREDVAAAEDGGYTVAVTTAVDAALAQEGTAREVVHRVQSLRREAGFELADRIILWLHTDGAVKAAVTAHADYVRGETLAAELAFAPPPGDAESSAEEVDGERVVIGVRRV